VGPDAAEAREALAQIAVARTEKIAAGWGRHQQQP
jgi:hypothetical protein